MKKVAEYQAHAAECRLMASRTANPEHKAMLGRMAETWENLAKDRLERQERKQRIAALDGLAVDDT